MSHYSQANKSLLAGNTVVIDPKPSTSHFIISSELFPSERGRDDGAPFCQQSTAKASPTVKFFSFFIVLSQH